MRFHKHRCAQTGRETHPTVAREMKNVSAIRPRPHGRGYGCRRPLNPTSIQESVARPGDPPYGSRKCDQTHCTQLLAQGLQLLDPADAGVRRPSLHSAGLKLGKLVKQHLVL